MGYITKYGTQWGSLPQTAGRIFWVSPTSSYVVEGRSYDASDGNDGLSPERALATVDRAVALTKLTAVGGATTASTNYGDVIALLPGTHTAAAALAFSQAGVTVIGLPLYTGGSHPEHAPRLMKPPVTLTVTGTVHTAVVTASDISFININFLPAAQKDGINFSSAAHRLRVLKCRFDLTTGNKHASTRGIAGSSTAQAPADLLISGCLFKEQNDGTTHGAAIDLSAATNFVVTSCHFVKDFLASSAAWTAAVLLNDNTTGMFSENVFFATGGAAGDKITAGISSANLTGTNVVGLYRNIVSAAGGVGTPFTGFAAGDADLCLNYVGTVAGGTGGTLITATT